MAIPAPHVDDVLVELSDVEPTRRTTGRRRSHAMRAAIRAFHAAGGSGGMMWVRSTSLDGWFGLFSR